MKDTVDRLLKLIRDFRGNPRDGILTALLAMVLTVGGISLTIIGTQMATGLWQVALDRLTFPMIRSEFLSLRVDLERAPCNPMLQAKAADWNQRLEHELASNRTLYADWGVTDQWNNLGRIHIACDFSSALRLLPQHPAFEFTGTVR